MELIQALPVWALAGLIVLLRIVDVSMGTMRTLAIVEGRIKISMVLGFFEVLVWIVAITQVIVRIGESPVLPVAYAAGFALGNASGIWLERKVAIGAVALRVISAKGDQVADALRQTGQAVTTFAGQGRQGPVTLAYATCPRSQATYLVERARAVDPDLFFVIERANTWGPGRTAVAHPGGWRAFWKKK